MPMDSKPLSRARVPVRTGPYQYVRVGPDGSTATIPVDRAALDAGTIEVDVVTGDRVMEIALSSTSDPDLDPPHGQLWPAEDGR